MRAEERTDRQKTEGQTWQSLIIAFRNFVNIPRNYPVDIFETSYWPCTKFPMSAHKIWTLVKVKVKFSPEEVTKAQRGSRGLPLRGLPLLFLQLQNQMGWVVNAPAALPLEKDPVPIVWPQGRSGRLRQSSPPTGIRSPDRPARSESLYWLSYPGPPLWTSWYDICGTAQSVVKFFQTSTEKKRSIWPRGYVANTLFTLWERSCYHAIQHRSTQVSLNCSFLAKHYLIPTSNMSHMSCTPTCSIWKSEGNRRSAECSYYKPDRSLVLFCKVIWSDFWYLMMDESADRVTAREHVTSNGPRTHVELFVLCRTTQCAQNTARQRSDSNLI
jgi:hypothetical protein